MNLTRVRLRNFLSHPDTDWSPDGRLAVLVGPKGAGKSAILDAVAYALFDTARAKTDDLVRRGASQMSVVVDFELSGVEYQVERGRSTTGGGKTYLTLKAKDVTSDDMTGPLWKPVAESSRIADVQEAIDDLLRVDGEAFASAVLLMQGRVDAFAKATAGERKAVLSIILGLEVYDAARERARSAKVDHDADQKRAWADHERLRDAIAIMPDYDAQIAEVEAQEKTTKEAIASLDRRIADLTVLIDAEAKTGANMAPAQDALANLNREKTLAVAQGQARLGAITGQARDTIDELQRQKATLDRTFRDQRATIAARHQAIESEIDTLQRVVDEAKVVTCPDCGAEFRPDDAHLRERLEGVRAKVADLPPIPDAEPDTKSIDEAIAAIRVQADEDRQEAQDEIDQATARLDQAIGELEAVIADATKMMAARQEAEASRARAQQDRGRYLNALRDYSVRLADLRARAERKRDMEAELAQVRDDWNAAGREAAMFGELTTAFGPGGIPARIIEDVLPELESAAQRVVDDLAPGATLALEATRASKTSGAVETLDILYQDTEGKRDVRLLSGGERTSVSLALSVSLARLIANRSGASIRTLVVDEPDGLDIETRRAFGQMVRSLAHQGDLERVVLVSHHPDLAEFGDAVYAVSRDARGSAVVQQ